MRCIRRSYDVGDGGDVHACELPHTIGKTNERHEDVGERGRHGSLEAIWKGSALAWYREEASVK